MVNDFEKMLDQIRVDIYEETKHMDSADVIAEINNKARELAREYGIKTVAATSKQSVANV